MFIESQKIITIVTDTNTSDTLNPIIQKKMFIEPQKIITIITDSGTSGVLNPLPQKKKGEKKVYVPQPAHFLSDEFLGIKAISPKDSFDTLQNYGNE